MTKPIDDPADSTAASLRDRLAQMPENLRDGLGVMVDAREDVERAKPIDENSAAAVASTGIRPQPVTIEAAARRHGMRPLGEVADGVVADMAAQGVAGPAALVAGLLLALEAKLKRKGYAGASIILDFTTTQRLWRLRVTARAGTTTRVPIGQRYDTDDLNKAIAQAETWVNGLPLESRR